MSDIESLSDEEYSTYLVPDALGAARLEQDAGQLAAPHGGGDVQRSVSVLQHALDDKYTGTCWPRAGPALPTPAYLVLLGHLALCADEDPGDSRVAVPCTRVQGRVSVLHNTIT